MAVEADQLVEQIVAKAVHHRHHDDQRGDAQHDAEERKAGDHRDRAMRAARPQVAQGDHPFERGERARRERRGGGGLGFESGGGHAAGPEDPTPDPSP